MKKLSTALLCLFLGTLPAFCQQADNGAPAPAELSVYAGAAASTTKHDINGQRVEYGGSGYALGFTALAYINDYAGVGLDISYSDNGSGGWTGLGGADYSVRTSHFTPMFAVKGRLFARSRFRLCAPLGVGMDFAEVYVNKSGGGSESDTSAGLALMAGLGFEFDVAPNAFIGVQGRYNYSNFLGKKMAGVGSTGSVGILFGAGIRFDGSFLM